MTPKRAIIVAAGMGRRLAPYTDDRPKCLVEVNGRSIRHFHFQTNAPRRSGIAVNRQRKREEESEE